MNKRMKRKVNKCGVGKRKRRRNERNAKLWRKGKL